MANKPSIVFFTHTPKWETQHKQFHRNTSCNLRIIRNLYQRTKATLQGLALPLREINENQQSGLDFGERLANAIQQTFDTGAEQVIVVGNDCPTLSKRDLQHAQTQLDRGQAVIGHSKDGGVYLIGLTRAHFDAISFAKLPWQTQQLGQALDQHLRRAGTLTTLQAKNDLNNTLALHQFLGQFSFFDFAKQLYNILQGNRQISYSPIGEITIDSILTRHYRGPPIV